MWKCVCCVFLAMLLTVVIPIVIFIGFYHPALVRHHQQHPKQIISTTTSAPSPTVSVTLKFEKVEEEEEEDFPLIKTKITTNSEAFLNSTMTPQVSTEKSSKKVVFEYEDEVPKKSNSSNNEIVF